jgi:hypothetical protein
MFLALLGLVAASAGAAERSRIDVELPFEMSKDALCFKNGDPDLAKTGIPVLGKLGVKKGVCQGIAAISGALRENAEFVPNAPADAPSEIERKLASAVAANREGSRAKIQIMGFSSVEALCQANRMAFLKKAVWLNSEIIVSDILPVYLQFSRLKKAPIETQKNPEALRRQLADTLAQTLAELREGRYPLLMFFSHVVLVRGYHDVLDEDGSRRIDLEVYDSNRMEALRTIPVTMAADGLPSGKNPMYWVLDHAASRH